MSLRPAGAPRRAARLALAAVLTLLWAAPASADGLERLRAGNAALDAGRLSEATAAYRDAAGERETAPIAWFNLGIVYARRGRPGDATAAFARAARLAGDDDRLASRAHYNRGVLLERAGDLSESLAAFKDALRRDNRPSSHGSR